MPSTLFRRARHVLTENRRVEAGVAAMRRVDSIALGEILCLGHASQRDDFETSRPEIDALVEIANSQPGCYGARLTGGGFGGCVVGLVRDADVESFSESVASGYRAAVGLDAVFYPTLAREGVRIVPVQGG